MKKADDLSLDKTLLFAQQCYAEKQNNSGENLLAHCKRVAYQAETIAHKLYQDLRTDYVPENLKDTVAAIIHCGLLHDVLNVRACAFETIAEVANVQIAAMVSALSRDFRLVETKRDMEFRGRLSQSAVGTQIVAVADIICTAKELLKTLERSGMSVVPKSKKILAQLDGDLLAVHAANKYYMLRLYVHAARNLLVDVSQKIKSCRQKAKADKAAASLAKKVQEAVDSRAKKDRRPRGKTKEKKQEVRYARKRNLRTDVD
jgi:(p)ppGpp synthase/HD superfamily hydrolase